MEKYLHKMQPRSWEEKQFVDSNDTQAKEKSQCANSKILLQLSNTVQICSDMLLYLHHK